MTSLGFFARFGVEVAEFQGFFRNLSKRCRLHYQAFPDPGSALGFLPKQKSTVFSLAYQFGTDFLFFNLKNDLNCSSQGVQQ
jgi:hypothetical protein